MLFSICCTKINPDLLQAKYDSSVHRGRNDELSSSSRREEQQQQQVKGGTLHQLSNPLFIFFRYVSIVEQPGKEVIFVTLVYAMESYHTNSPVNTLTVPAEQYAVLSFLIEDSD